MLFMFTAEICLFSDRFVSRQLVQSSSEITWSSCCNAWYILSHWKLLPRDFFPFQISSCLSDQSSNSIESRYEMLNRFSSMSSLAATISSSAIPLSSQLFNFVWRLFGLVGPGFTAYSVEFGWFLLSFDDIIKISDLN